MQNISGIVPLVAYLGAKFDDPGLNHYLTGFGKKPKLNIVEYTAGLSYTKYGISLSFIDEEWTVENGEPFTKGAWILRGFFLYSNGHEGFDQYKGPLPEKVSFFDHRAMARVKLGEPHSTGGGNKFGNTIFPVRDQYLLQACEMSLSYLEDKVIMVTFCTLQEIARLRK